MISLVLHIVQKKNLLVLFVPDNKLQDQLGTASIGRTIVLYLREKLGSILLHEGGGKGEKGGKGKREAGEHSSP